MPTPRVMECSRAIPVEVQAAFSRTLPIPLPMIFNRRYGPIGPVTAVRDQSGEWGSVGQSRTVVQAGGTTLREELTRVDAPDVFGYRLSEVRGPLAPLVDHVEGEWQFDPVGTGTQVTWRWTVYPKSAVAALALPVFARIWQGFARQALERLSEELLSP
ncbi:MAG TPA: SRPBCC family protein [Mycobacterium sp.]|nr:SRPBCC family protein [Mycobacterium sp.]